MSAFVKEFLQVTKESAFGTIMPTPVRGTDQIVIRLSGANQFTGRPNPIAEDYAYGGGIATIAGSISDKTELKLGLKTELCYSQAAVLLGWGMQRINTAQTAPWTTTEPANQYASCTVDHAIWNEDTGTYKRTRYPGVKVDKTQVDCSDQQRRAMLSLDLLGSVYQGNAIDGSTDPTATDFPVPLDTEYPTDFVLFSHSRNNFFLGSLVTARAWYESLSLSVGNQHDVHFFAGHFAQLMRSFGRQISLSADVTLIATPDDRATFQSLGALASKVIFTNTTHTITFDFHANGRISGLDDDLQLGKLYGRKLAYMGRHDAAAGSSFDLTVA